MPESARRTSSSPTSRSTAPTDLLHRLLDDPSTPLVRADLVVEWDVAVKRALPWPSSVSGVFWSAFYEPSVARRLPRTAFAPPPSVDAGVLVLRRRRAPLVRVESAADYRCFVASGFRRGLGRLAPGRLARDLDAHEWTVLFDKRAAAQQTTHRDSYRDASRGRPRRADGSDRAGRDAGAG